MMKLFIYLVFILNIIFSESNSNSTIELTTSDGNIFIGSLIEENEKYYKIKTRNGISIEVPKSTVKEINYLELSNFNDEFYRPDPNKSMYLFAPSAYQIGDGNSYIRDFQIFFPSYNRGLNNNISIQAGALTFPFIPLEYLPIILSAKYSFKRKNKLQFSSGMLYMTTPFNFESNWATGIAFSNATYGDLFNHYSICFGWGYFRDDEDLNFMEKPIVVLAGNNRLSDRLALVYEFWTFPDLEINYSPLIVSARFIGRKFSVDIGAGSSLELLQEGGIPFPVLNFTYHP